MTDYYVSYYTGGDGNDGLSWSSPWKTVNKAATTVPDGSIVHIGFSPYTNVGTYNNEPAGNKIAPQNIGSLGIQYKIEAYNGDIVAGSVIIEKN